MGLLDMFGQSRDYYLGQAMQQNPAMLQQYIKQKQQQQEQDQRMMYLQGLMGQQEAPAQAGVYANTAGPETKYGAMDLGQTPMQAQPVPVSAPVEAQEGSGVLGGNMPTSEVAMRLMMAPTKESRAVGGQMLNQQMKPTTPGNRTTFEVGAGNGMRQRMSYNAQGQAEPVGEPYRAFAPNPKTAIELKMDALLSGDPDKIAAVKEAMRNPYVKTETAYRDVSGANPDVSRQVGEGEFIKGAAKADTEFYSNYTNTQDALSSSISDVDRTLANLNELSGLTNNSTTGFGAWLSPIPTSDAGYWQSLKSTIASNISLDKLNQMKQQSATGASGMGAMSQTELQLLLDHLGALDQTNDPKKIKSTIGKIYRSLDRNKRNMQQAMVRNDKRYGRISSRFDKYRTEGYTGPGRQEPATPATPAGGLAIGTVKRGFEYIGGPPGSQSSWRKVQ